jgi:hypothetical protein
MRCAGRRIARRPIALVLMVLVMLPSVALAQDQPIVRVTLSPESVSVGHAADMRVTVLVPTWFASPPVFPSFEIANAITRLPADSSYPTSERVGNSTWSGIVRDYRIYPLLGATYRISGQSVLISYANPGGQPSLAEITIPDIVLRATVPTGAEHLQPYLAGRELQLSQEIEGDVAALQRGDAIVVTYTAVLDGLPAMFLPRLAPHVELEGVSIYADTPVVEDVTPARRREKLTLVFESGGEFTLPAVGLDWWNTAAGRLERASVAAVLFSVAGPTTTGASMGTTNHLPAGWWLTAVFAALLAAVLTRRRLPALTSRLRAALHARRQSEPHAFKDLRGTIRHGDPKTVYHAMLHWLERIETGLDLRRFTVSYGTDELSAAVYQLTRATYSNSAAQPDLRGLYAELAAARRRWQDTRSPATGAVLPNLNP